MKFMRFNAKSSSFLQVIKNGIKESHKFNKYSEKAKNHLFLNKSYFFTPIKKQAFNSDKETLFLSKVKFKK